MKSPSRSLASASRGFFGVSLALFGACAQPVQGSAPPAANRPQVSVAVPVVTSVTEFSEHTGRAEAPGSVEIRARASGYLTQAGFHEGDLVKKGDLLFVIDTRPYRNALARAKAELESLRADRELAQRNADRAQHLLETDAISQREWDSQNALVHTLAARADVASAAVAAAELDLEYAFVRSPIDGRVGRILVTPGNLVGPSTAMALTTVVSVDPLYVYIDLDEAHALRLGRDSGVTARVGFAGEDGHPHEARLDFFDNHVEPSTGTLKARAVVSNRDGRLTDGLFARVRLSEGAAHPVVLVSDRAIATDQDRRFVWVLGSGDKVAYRAVKLGPLEQGLRVVREGLSPSDRVVVRGLQRVRPGVEVLADAIAMGSVDNDEHRAGAL
jgi:multidrug efflux system membrane fusion protein